MNIQDHWLVPQIEAPALPAIRHCPSDNAGPAFSAGGFKLVVIHAISLPPETFGGSYIEDLFCNRLDTSQHSYFKSLQGVRVSAHLLVKRSGEVVQFVGFDSVAWHAGVSCFNGQEKCNDFSVGIELEGCDRQPFEAAQYQRLLAILDALAKTYSSFEQTRALAGHCDIAPGRKTDPGPHFDWSILQSAGFNTSA